MSLGGSPVSKGVPRLDIPAQIGITDCETVIQRSETSEAYTTGSGCFVSYPSVGGLHGEMAVRPNRCAVSFTVILLARRLMLSVDVDELENLKYGYKGA